MFRSFGDCHIFDHYRAVLVWPDTFSVCHARQHTGHVACDFSARVRPSFVAQRVLLTKRLQKEGKHLPQNCPKPKELRGINSVANLPHTLAPLKPIIAIQLSGAHLLSNLRNIRQLQPGGLPFLRLAI